MKEGVIVGVDVGAGVKVEVGVGINVGPNKFPGPQDVRSNDTKSKNQKAFLIMFILYNRQNFNTPVYATRSKPKSAPASTPKAKPRQGLKEIFWE